MSNPVTLKRSALKSSASGRPTYPIPTMPIWASRDSILSLIPAKRLSVAAVISIIVGQTRVTIGWRKSRAAGSVSYGGWRSDALFPLMVLAISFVAFRLAGFEIAYFADWQNALRAALGVMFLLTALAHWGKRR